MPFLPVFGGGTTRFQPVFAGDIGRAIELLSKSEEKENNGLVIQAGGPEGNSIREM